MVEQEIRIFVSSPGDVAQEREIAERVIHRLDSEFGETVKLTPFLWEYEPVRITEDYQAQIEPPSTFDIVICILWSRLGSRLHSSYTLPDGRVADSGTEWEFVDAFEHHRLHATPEILVWVNKTKPTVALDDPDSDERFSQWKKLQAFLERWTRDEREKLFKGALNSYRSLAQFEEKLEIGLRKVIERRTGEIVPEVAAPEWEGNPYRGLDVFEFEHAPIFFGRTAEIGEVVNKAQLRLRGAWAREEALTAGGAALDLEEVMAEGYEDELRRFEPRAFVLIFGASGSGKSSLVRAGVLPMLVEGRVIEGIGLWRYGIMKPSDGGSSNLMLALATAIASETALPEITRDGTTTGRLTQILNEEPRTAPTLIKGALSQAAAALQAEQGAILRGEIAKHEAAGRTADVEALTLTLNDLAQPRACLILVLDQLEELFTSGFEREEVEDFFVAIDALARDGRVLILATLRSDFFADCTDYPLLMNLKEAEGGSLQLRPPDRAALLQMVRGPAQKAGVRFEEDPEKGRLEDIIVDAAIPDQDCLPLLQICLEQLFEQNRATGGGTDSRLLEFEEYDTIGGLKGVLSRHADHVFEGRNQRGEPVLEKQLRPVEQEALDEVLRKLTTVAEDGGGGGEEGKKPRAVRRTVLREELERIPGAAGLIEKFVEGRLFIAGKDVRDRQVISVTHEALLRNWAKVQAWFNEETNQRFLAIRDDVVQRRKKWEETDQEKSLLLQKGSELTDAENLLDEFPFGFETAEQDYIRASIRERGRRQRLQWQLVGTVIVMLSALTGAALWAVENALQSRDDAWKTEGLQALEKARGAPDVHPDAIFYTAKAIGFSGFSGAEPKPYRSRIFLAPSFWKAAGQLLGGAERTDFPILVPGELDAARLELAAMPAYLPFWRSGSCGTPVAGIEVTATHLRVGYGDGTVREWELGMEQSGMREASGPVTASAESSGVQFEGTTVKLRAFGHHVDLTCHPSPPTAWAFPEDERVLYIGMEDGSVIAWGLERKLVGNRNLRAYLSDGWLAFDEEDQQLHGRASAAAEEFAALPKPEDGEFDPSKKQPFRNSVGMELVFVEPGTFQMGSDSEEASDDETPHDVTLSNGFWMGAYEVTQAEWKAVMGDNPSDFKDPRAPVETVDWNLVNEYCRKLTESERRARRLPEGWSYHLPTEAQWEYACRAGTKTEYFFGDDLQPDQANFGASAIGKTVTVGRYQPNKWGLYDMHGNVYEWCWDWYGDYEPGPDGQPVKDPVGPASGGIRVGRGGGWYDVAGSCRSANRYGNYPDGDVSILGFRVALSSSPPGGKFETRN